LPPKDPKKGADALAAFAKAIENPHNRKQYAENQITLAELIQPAGGNADDLDDNVKSFLNGLNEPQLQLLSTMQETMAQAGLSEPTTSHRTLAKF
jgi:hypothetical protein